MVDPPTPKELINCSVKEIETIFKLEMVRGMDVTHEFSTFTAYAARISSVQDIPKFYKKLKLIQPDARHIPCAYSVAHSVPFLAEDYQDDGEPSAGRSILNFLQVNEIKDIVVFVARKYGGVKIGSERFQCYVQATKDAVEKLLNVNDLKLKDEIQNNYRHSVRDRGGRQGGR